MCLPSLRPALDVSRCVLVASFLAGLTGLASTTGAQPAASAPAPEASQLAPPEPPSAAEVPPETGAAAAPAPAQSPAEASSPAPSATPPTPPPAAPAAPAPGTVAAPRTVEGQRYGRFGHEEGESSTGPGEWDPWLAPVRERFTHDGFFLRLMLGPGYTAVSRPDFRWSGLGVGMNLSVGGAVVRNFVIHADLRGVWLGNPRQRTGGHSSDFDADIVFESVGAGATYYFMPYNVYVTAGAGIGVLAFEDNAGGTSKDSKPGLTLNAALGKEWWVGSDWGLGVAGQIVYTRVQDYIDDKHLHGLAINVMFSATYN